MSLPLPWLDRSGRFSALKSATFLALLWPAAGIVLAYAQGPSGVQGPFGPRPAMAINHEAGLWAIRLLLLSLAITPLRQSLRLPGLIQVRRMIGVAAFFYAAIHFCAFAADKMLDAWVILSEIALRFYLTIGATVLVSLLALAATSTDAMARRLGGKRWRRLHYLAYPAGLLAIVHFFLQSKVGASEATVLAGLFFWLMAYRLRAPSSWPGLAPLAIGAAIVTVLGEAAYFGLFTGIDPMRVLQANIALVGQRPGWIVLGIGLAIAALAAARQVGVARIKANGPRVAAGR